MSPRTFSQIGCAVVGLLCSVTARPDAATKPLGADDEASPDTAAAALYETAVTAAGRAAQSGVRADWTAVDRALDAAEDALHRARFDDVLDSTAGLRAAIVARGEQAGWRERRSRVELLAATVHVALHDALAADAAMRRALVALPTLELDRTLVSPRVVAVLDRTRRSMFSPSAHDVKSVSALETSDLVGPRDQPPSLTFGEQPTLPGNAAPGLRPTVTIRMLIDANGDVVRAHIHRPRPGLASVEAVALAAAREYRFEPARRDGAAVSAWINWPVRLQ